MSSSNGQAETLASRVAPPAAWKPSRFNMWTRDSGGLLLVYNSFSSAFQEFRDQAADSVAAILSGQAILETDDVVAALIANGILVPLESDELRRAQLLHQSLFESDQRLQLILMPTEQCNFRCVYCYEDFARGRMRREVIEGIVRLVEREAPKLRTLSIGWFGGEPLSALDVVEEISHRVLDICQANHIRYDADMTTNGYLLTTERATRCFAAHISKFQVTLDGPPETHNRLRVLARGGDTFDKILTNLVSLRDQEAEFHVRLRVNFTPHTAPAIPAFLQWLGSEFAGDHRFSISFHPVAHLGGPHDELIEVCDEKSADLHEIEFMGSALESGFGLDAWKEDLQPFGHVCYAADPRSFVIGSDGTVYKCTVAFKDPRNQVGTISPDGELNVSDDLVELWTSSGEEVDTGCQQCAVRPACQGNVCPLERLNTGGEKVCPPIKRHAGRILPLLATEARRSVQELEVR